MDKMEAGGERQKYTNNYQITNRIQNETIENDMCRLFIITVIVNNNNNALAATNICDKNYSNSLSLFK